MMFRLLIMRMRMLVLVMAATEWFSKSAMFGFVVGSQAYLTSNRPLTSISASLHTSTGNSWRLRSRGSASGLNDLPGYHRDSIGSVGELEGNQTHATRHIDGMPADSCNVTVIGGGSFGTAIARRLAINAATKGFASYIKLWLKDQIHEGRSLVNIINEDHTNPVFLPDVLLPNSVLAFRDLNDACQGANILVVAVPHQYVESVINELVGKVNPETIVISLCKGLFLRPEGPQLISDLIAHKLHINHVAVLMGANVAKDVARDEYVETTIACQAYDHSFDNSINGDSLAAERSSTTASIQRLLNFVFTSPEFRVQDASDCATVELCGALKNVIAMGAGFCDGLGLGPSTKAAVIRQGIVEIRDFCRMCSKDPDRFDDTIMLQSCGVGDVIATSLGGRNSKCSAEFVNRVTASIVKGSFAVGSPEAKIFAAELWNQIELEMLAGQKLQGVSTAQEVTECIAHYDALAQANKTGDFELVKGPAYPLLKTIYAISSGQQVPSSLFDW